MSLTQCLNKTGFRLYKFLPSMEGAVIMRGLIEGIERPDYFGRVQILLYNRAVSTAYNPCCLRRWLPRCNTWL